MDIANAFTELEAAVRHQMQIGGGDEALEAAADGLLLALRPALHRTVLHLAEQAAAEVTAQLDAHDVEVVMRSGEPHLAVRPLDAGAAFSTEDLKARLTVRLPRELKEELESAAEDLGDSVNAYVIKALAARSGRRSARRGRRVTGTVET